MKKAAVIGAGIFGLYCAIELLKNDFQVDIYEQAKYVGQCASKANQARLHLGYHYPRSRETALQCIRGFHEFQKRFPKSINNRFRQYYAIASKNSKTTPDEYLDFCNNLNLPYEVVKPDEEIINEKLIDLCIEVPEVAFEYSEIINQLVREIRGLGGLILLDHKVISGDIKSRVKTIEYRSRNRNEKGLRKYDVVVNASYANINGLNHAFGIRKEPLVFEMCEMALVSVPQKYNSVGVTIMDGDFCATMPFGFSGYQAIIDVRLTPRERSHCDLPTFKCNKQRDGCSFENIDLCLVCEHAPSSNIHKIIGVVQQYIPYVKHSKFVETMFVVKTILNYVEDTDARPSIVYTYREVENYFVLFSGKVGTVIHVVGELIRMLKG